MERSAVPGDLTIAAFGSKVAVGLLVGRMQRWPLTTSAQLGISLNCRGITDLAIASVGLQAHLIGPYAFALLGALAIVTTAVTAPLYRAVNNFAHAPTSPADVGPVARVA